MVYFDQVLYTNTCQHYLTTGMCSEGGRGFAEHHFSRLWSVSEKFITLEPHGIFGSNFACLFILEALRLIPMRTNPASDNSEIN